MNNLFFFVSTFLVNLNTSNHNSNNTNRKNRKIDFSFNSAHCASFMKMVAKLRRGEGGFLHIPPLSFAYFLKPLFSSKIVFIIRDNIERLWINGFLGKRDKLSVQALNPLGTTVPFCSKGFRGAFNWAP